MDRGREFSMLACLDLAFLLDLMLGTAVENSFFHREPFLISDYYLK